MQVPPDCPLTVRQYEVMRLLADGLTQRDIADRLNIKYTTVCNHVFNAAQTLGTSGETATLAACGRNGWLAWEPPFESDTPLAVDHPFLAAYLVEFERSRWPHEPDTRSVRGMRLALAGQRNTQTISPAGRLHAPTDSARSRQR